MVFINVRNTIAFKNSTIVLTSNINCGIYKYVIYSFVNNFNYLIVIT